MGQGRGRVLAPVHHRLLLANGQGVGGVSAGGGHVAGGNRLVGSVWETILSDSGRRHFLHNEKMCIK